MAARCRAFAMTILALTSLTGCAQKTMYDWGEYQNSLYAMWVEPEDFDLADHTRILEDQVLETEAEQRTVPPGVRAHLGYLYYTAGDAEAAARLLTAEKTAFPESTVFVDGLLARMSR